MAESEPARGSAVTPTVPRIDLSSLQLGDELGEGGQGRVFAVNGYLIREQWTAALKVYTAPSVDVTALETIAGFHETLNANDRDWLDKKTAWPAVIVVADQAVRGFLMRTVPSEYYFDFPATGGTEPRLANMTFLLNDDRYISGLGLRVDQRDRIALLQDLARILSRLHSFEVAVGDFSPKNLLFCLKPNPSCFLIDCDAMRVGDASVLEQVQTPDWEVPTDEETATPKADVYKFALLAIRLFARDQSSRDRTALALLSPALGDLAARSLSLEPSQRPSIEDWQPALARAYKKSLYRSLSRDWLTPAKILGIFLIVATVILAVILLVLSTGSHPVSAAPTTTSPHATSSQATSSPHASGETASAQAAQINYLLNASAATVNPLATALQDVRDCNDISSAIATIRAVAQRYGTEYGLATRLNTGQLPNGAALKNDLVDGYYYSAIADYYFVEWAQELKASGCVSSTSAAAAYNAGVVDTGNATTAKDAFTQLWNPIAKSEGLPSRSAHEI
jgi:hypothetical protein